MSNPTHGQKVTTDPASQRNPVHEGVGMVTSDSLAAESLQNSGEFGAGNPKAAASNQPSASSTANTTDTSNATRLDAAVDAHAREAKHGWSEEQSLQAGKGLGKESGVGPTYNDIGSSVNSSGVRRGVSTGSQIGADGVQGNIAPTGAYAQPHHVGGPKGANLTEDPELKGKTVFGEIGTRQDAGRVAEHEFAKRAAAIAGVGHADLAQGGDSKFSTLDAESKV
ncbi:hypothetical protein ACEQ8H_002511 [Pleosporales sp. CAS-2024a]